MPSKKNKQREDIKLLSDVFVSVIIPVYNDEILLRKCLQSLKQQTYPSELIEIIVVDNGSEQKADDLITSFEQVTFLEEPTPGSYAARNTGISKCKGDVLAFLDSDCIPHNDWLLEGISALEQADVVGGKMVFLFKNPNNPSATELFDSLSSFRQKEYIEQSHYSITANLIAKREVFTAIGPFDQNLKSGGDREWGTRAYTAGYKVLYAEKVVVYHPARYPLSAVLKKHRRVAGGIAQKVSDTGKVSWQKFARSQIVEILIFLRLCKEILCDGKIPPTKMPQVIGVNVLITLVRVLEPYRVLMGGSPSR